MIRKRGGIESKVLSHRERRDMAWMCEQAISLWTINRRRAITNCQRKEIIRAKWHLRRATRLLERIRPSAKPCKKCGEWKSIKEFYWHNEHGNHDTRCIECRRGAANERYRQATLGIRRFEAIQ